MAETYGVYDLRELPLQTTAVLAQGLHADSRIMRRLAAAQERAKEPASYDTPEAFWAARAKIVKGD